VSTIEKSDIEKIAYLARLGIDEQAIPEYAQSLTDILTFVEQMDKVNTDDVLPMAHPQDMLQRLRTDIITEENQRETLQSNAPLTEDGLFLVPKVIE